MNIDNAVQIIKEELSRDSRILAVYILGSVARGHARPDSDIDVGIITIKGDYIDALERSKIENHLTSIVGRKVDIGLISSRNLVYAREAFFSGKMIYARDKFHTDLTVATLLGMYARFNEDRREVLDAYRTR